MEQLVPWLMFCAAVSILCLIRPNAARIFIGVFFIIMALAVNVLLSIIAPDQFVRLGTDAPLIPFYAWFFETVVALSPPLFGILAATGEIAVGLLILSSGRRVKQGLVGAILFLMVITPLGVWTLPNPILAAGSTLLLTKNYPKSMLQLLRRSPSHPTAAGKGV